MLGNATQPVGQRLASLDILRGFDLFLLVFLQPVLVSLGACVDSSVMNAVLYQFDHEVWEGFRFWDLVMPLFLFMTGVSMPFSFSKYEREENRWFIYKKVLRRFVILFLLGMVVQGNLLDVSVVVGLLVPYDILGGFHAGREFCREGGPFCLGPIP